MAIHAPITGAPSRAPIPDVSFMSVQRACRVHGIPPSTFGRRAMNDPRLVHDMSLGRELKPRTRMKVAAFIASLEVAQA